MSKASSFAPRYGPWEPVPMWAFWRRMIGHNIRRMDLLAGTYDIDLWQYTNDKLLARKILANTFAGAAERTTAEIIGTSDPNNPSEIKWRKQ